MRVALIQFNAGPDKKENVRRACQWVRVAASRKARFILFPEVFNLRKKILKENILSLAESIPGESTSPFLDLAKKHKAYILLGSLLTRPKIFSNGKVSNTSVLIGPNGKILTTYNKINLFDAIIGKIIVRESENFLPGQKKVLTPVDEFTVGMSICYDLRFPELYRHHFCRGANLLTVPSNFTSKTGQAHWEPLLRARAIENLSYVLAPNQVGVDGKGILSYGHSMIISPWGEVLAKASGNKEEIIYSDISLAEVKKCRQVLPSIGKIISTRIFKKT